MESVFPFSSVNSSAIPWDFILILIVLGALVPWRGAVRVRRLLAQPALTTTQRLSLYASTIAFQWLFVAVIYWRTSSRHVSPGELGLVVTDIWKTVLVTLVFTSLLCLNQWAGLRKIASIPADQRGFLFQFTQKIMPQTSTEAVAFVALACTAGLSEEFEYRGFVFAVFSRIFAGAESGIILAIAGSSVMFAMAHLYQGRRGVITTLVVGVIFCLVRAVTGNLIPAIVGHTAVDLVAGLYAPRALRGWPDSAPPPNPADGRA